MSAPLDHIVVVVSDDQMLAAIELLQDLFNAVWMDAEDEITHQDHIIPIAYHLIMF
jgi:hypothetical protein